MDTGGQNFSLTMALHRSIGVAKCDIIPESCLGSWIIQLVSVNSLSISTLLSVLVQFR